MLRKAALLAAAMAAVAVVAAACGGSDPAEDPLDPASSSPEAGNGPAISDPAEDHLDPASSPPEADNGPAISYADTEQLRTAAAAAYGVFAIILKGGMSNFAAEPVSDGRIGGAVSAYDGRASRAAVEVLSQHEPGFVFQAKADYGDIAAKAATIRDDGAPEIPVVWVQVNGTQIDSGDSEITLPDQTSNGQTRLTKVPPNTAIRPGDLIRLGIVTANGSSLCLVRVADSTDGTATGDGWQTADAASTAAGDGADCGSEAIGDNGASSPEEYKEMPRTAGVEPTLGKLHRWLPSQTKKPPTSLRDASQLRVTGLAR